MHACTNPDCGLPAFPRTDAVAVAEHAGRCLTACKMARSPMPGLFAVARSDALSPDDALAEAGWFSRG